ncbi:hypothetical protein KF728_18590 [Candidatus Obscuribacterales bacterium]|nr:hypothetical protein [Candidatus Obscuribacterales bacterium]
MSFEKNYRTYLDELDRLYRRAMEVPLKGMTHEQVAEIKQHQFFTKTQKDRLKHTAPELIRTYNNAKAALLITMGNDAKATVLEQQIASLEKDLESLKANLQKVSDELESALLAVGANKPVSEREIVNPIDTLLSIDEKVDALQRLSKENEPVVEAFMVSIDAELGTQSNANFKKPERIKEKAQRPEIVRKKPWFDVEHIRDGYRFKTVLMDLSVLPKIAQAIKASGFEVVKLDTAKLLKPGMWGWRIVAFDLRMPNGQLVEYYLPVAELERVKDSCHDLFAKWRNEDLENLNPADRSEFMLDLETSDDKYQEAWNTYLERTGQTEDQLEKLLEEVYDAIYE